MQRGGFRCYGGEGTCCIISAWQVDKLCLEEASLGELFDKTGTRNEKNLGRKEKIR